MIPQYHIFIWIGATVLAVAAIIVLAIIVELRKQRTKIEKNDPEN